MARRTGKDRSLVITSAAAVNLLEADGDVATGMLCPGDGATVGDPGDVPDARTPWRRCAFVDLDEAEPVRRHHAGLDQQLADCARAVVALSQPGVNGLGALEGGGLDPVGAIRRYHMDVVPTEGKTG